MIENGNMTMPVQPMYGGGNNGSFGGDLWSLIVLFFLMMICGGWGNGFGNGNGGNVGGQLYPWMNQQAQMQEGFQNQMLNTQIEGIRSGQVSGFGDVNLGIAGLGRQICETGNAVTGAVRDGFYGVELGANQRQMATMQQNFGIQTGIGDVKYTIANEECQTRNQSMMNTRDIIDNQNNMGQKIMDKLCQLELDGVKAERDSERRANAELREEVTRLTLGNQLATGFANEVDQLYNRLNSCPVPTTPVYGRTPIFTCNQNPQYSGCGCNGNNGFVN